MSFLCILGLLQVPFVLTQMVQSDGTIYVTHASLPPTLVALTPHGVVKWKIELPVQSPDLCDAGGNTTSVTEPAWHPSTSNVAVAVRQCCGYIFQYGTPCSGTTVHQISTKTSSLVWSTKFDRDKGKEGDVTSLQLGTTPVSPHDGSVFVRDNGKETLIALDASDGHVMWETRV